MYQLLSFLFYLITEKSDKSSTLPHTALMRHTCTLLIDIASEQAKTHPYALSDHPFPTEPLAKATVCNAMVTKYSSNDELSSNTTCGENFIVCLCMRVFVF